MSTNDNGSSSIQQRHASSRSALRRGKYGYQQQQQQNNHSSSSSHRSHYSSSNHEPIQYLDEAGFPISTTMNKDVDGMNTNRNRNEPDDFTASSSSSNNNSSSTHNNNNNVYSSSNSNNYGHTEGVSTADEILERVQASRRKRAAAASLAASSNRSNDVDYDSYEAKFKAMEQSKLKSKALALEYGMALESSRSRMKALEQEIQELKEYKEVEDAASLNMVELTQLEHQEILACLKANAERITSLEGHNNSLQQQNAQITKQHEDSQAEFQRTLKELEKFHSDMHSEKDTEFEQKENELATCREELENVKAELGKVEELKDLVAKLQKECEEAKASTSAMTVMRDEMAEMEGKAKTRINYFEDKYKTAQSQVQQTEKQAKETIIRNKILEKELSEYKLKLTQMQRKFDDYKRDYDEKATFLEKEMRNKYDNSKAIKTLEEKVALLSQNNKVLSAKEISLSRYIKQKDGLIEELKVSLEEVKSDKEKLLQQSTDEMRLVEQVEKLERDNRSLMGDLKSQETVRASLEKQLEQALTNSGDKQILKVVNDDIVRSHSQSFLEEKQEETNMKALMNENKKLTMKLEAMAMEKKSLEATLELYDLNLEEEEQQKQRTQESSSNFSRRTQKHSENVEDKRRIGDEALLKYMNIRRGSTAENITP